MEVWKEISGSDGNYLVSNLGRVKSNSRTVRTYYGNRITNERIRKPQNHNNGYLFVALPKPIGQKLIHRLVANEFLTNEHKKEFVNHINGIKTDNRVDNLEWVTRIENEKHAFDTGLKKSYGEYSNSSKLKNWQVFYIKNCGKSIDSKILAQKFKVNRATIQRILNGKIWLHI
jgi:hypothetical protein